MPDDSWGGLQVYKHFFVVCVSILSLSRLTHLLVFEWKSNLKMHLKCAPLFQ